jgi:hypothetical protein
MVQTHSNLGTDQTLDVIITEGESIRQPEKWSRKDVKRFVTPRELVFQFSDDKRTRIPLPEYNMVVAVAPFLKCTHS